MPEARERSPIIDANRFDDLSRALSRRLSRRRTLKLGGAAGALAVAQHTRLSGAQVGFGCAITFEARVASGPSAGTAYDGVFDLTIDPATNEVSGSYTPLSGGPFSLSGYAIGHALDLTVTLSNQQTLAFSGTLAEPIGQCGGLSGGLFGGPALGDTGPWFGTSSSSSGSGQTTGATTAPSGGSSGSSSSSSGGDPVCMPIECGSLVQDPVTCACVCAPGTTPCGENCCPAGAVCMGGTCGCPEGTEQCGTSCVPFCPPGEFLDYDMCACIAEPACVPSGGFCTTDDECCSFDCIDGGTTCA